MREIFLCKYGEMMLKGANRSSFEALLSNELKYRLGGIGHGKFTVRKGQSVMYIEPAPGYEPTDAEYSAAYGIAMTTFGIAAVCRSAATGHDFEKIASLTVSYLGERLRAARTFKVEARRADKRFPMHSADINAELGARILGAFPSLRVDVHDPDVTVRCDIRENFAYVGADKVRAAGGMPVGSNGRAMLLLSGGIDSPVAGWMMAKRGVKLDAVYFETPPYTGIQAKEKVIALARILSRWNGSLRLYSVSLTEIEEQIAKHCSEEYFTLLLRRYMMRAAERLAVAGGCGALITGESLGQVASQTMEALKVTGSAVSVPVFRPCIGLDKEEIIGTARKIGSYETSVLPYEDCCVLFTPRHPKTRPKLADVEAEDAKLGGLTADSAADAAEVTRIGYFDHISVN